MLRASQGFALVNGRDYVVPEDIKAVAIPVMAHRLIGEIQEEQKKAEAPAREKPAPQKSQEHKAPKKKTRKQKSR